MHCKRLRANRACPLLRHLRGCGFWILRQSMHCPRRWQSDEASAPGCRDGVPLPSSDGGDVH
eukprot:3253460-Rhodomonas_salina.1